MIFATPNFNGRQLENMVANHLTAIGFRETSQHNFRRNTPFTFSRQYKLDELSIIYKQIRVDFILSSFPNYENGIIIEAKWQQAHGSVDEKYPALVMNIKQKYPIPTMVVLDGRGYESGTLRYLKESIDDKLIGVFNMCEFQIWGNKMRSKKEIEK